MAVRRLCVSTFAVALALAARSARADLITYELHNLVTVESETAGVYNGPGFVQSNLSLNHQAYFDISTNWNTAMAVDLSAIEGATITSATVSFVISVISTPGQAIARSYVSDGVLGNFHDPVSPLAATAPFALGSNNSIDVTGLLQERIDADAGWFGLNFESVGGAASTHTISDPDAAQLRLTVDYIPVPEPQAFALFGLMGLFATRRRR